MKLGIIAALDVELEKVESAMENLKSETVGAITFHLGTIGKNEVVCAICGMGKVCAAMCAQTMVVKYNVDAMINTGIAGTLSPDLGVGDIAISTGLVQHDIDVYDLDKTPLGHHPSLGIIEFPADRKIVDTIEKIAIDIGARYQKGVIATGDQFISKAVIKEKLADTFHAIACEMEGGAVAQICYMNKIPYAVIRSISDGANENSFEDYYSFKMYAAKISSEIATRLAREL